MGLYYASEERIRRILLADGEWHPVAPGTLRVAPNGLTFQRPDNPRRVHVHRDDVRAVEEVAGEVKVVDLHR